MSWRPRDTSSEVAPMFNVTSLHYLGVDTDAQVSPARGTLQVDRPLLRSAGVTAVTPIVRTNPNDRRQRGLSRRGARSGRCARFCPGAGRAPSLPTVRLRLPRPHPAPHSPALSPKDRTPGSARRPLHPEGVRSPCPWPRFSGGGGRLALPGPPVSAPRAARLAAGSGASSVGAVPPHPAVYFGLCGAGWQGAVSPFVFLSPVSSL